MKYTQKSAIEARGNTRCNDTISTVAGAALARHEFEQLGEQLTARDGIETQCGLIQHQQFRVSRQRQYQRKLHARTE
jgi:hypothetical protein